MGTKKATISTVILLCFISWPVYAYFDNPGNPGILELRSETVEVSSEGFLASFNGYRFRVDHLIYSCNESPVGAVLSVQRLDDTVVSAYVTGEIFDVVNDSINISFVEGSVEGDVQTAVVSVSVASSGDTPVEPIEATDEGFLASFEGYKFKVDALIYSEHQIPSGVALLVQRPDGTLVEAQATAMTVGIVDFNLQISFVGGCVDGGIEKAVLTVTNTSSETVEGDADGDGLVNYSDLVILAASYGLGEGDSGFDSGADFNGDGLVDYEDLVILAANYDS